MLRKSTLFSFLAVFFTLSACSEPLSSAPNAARSSDGNALLLSDTRQTTAGYDHWAEMSSEDLWAHVAALDSTVTVGLKAPGAARGVDDRGRALLDPSLWEPLTGQLIDAVGATLLYVDDLHPFVDLRIGGMGSVRALRALPYVAYVEPASFDPSDVLMSSCEADATASGEIEPPGDLVPHTLLRHRVRPAWQLATGAGIKIGVVDTGTSVYQPQLQSEFADGQSSGRSIAYDFTDANGNSGPPEWNDTNSHGTKILGLAAAPRDGKNVVGVAYAADAVGIRSLDGVFAGPGRWGEVREGIRRAADKGLFDSDIVNMAWGWSWGNTSVASTIEYYHDDPDHNTLFIGAAGTCADSVTDVVFPADMPEVVAVTGLAPSGTSPCSLCHYGPQVEFAAYTTGQTTGLNENQISRIGGSSGATAIVSGIAALVWSRDLTQTRAQVLQRLRNAARFKSNRQSDIGYGEINALLAVGGFIAGFYGPDEVDQSGTYNYSIAVIGGHGPFTYQWANNPSTAPSASFTFTQQPDDYTEQLEVTVTDTSTGYSSTYRYDVVVKGTNSGGPGGPGDGNCGNGIPC